MVSLILFGLLFLGVGIFLLRSGVLDSTEVKVLGDEQSRDMSAGRDSSIVMTVEIAGSVLKPGVYQLQTGARIDDLLIQAGGLSAGADRDWVAKNLNRAVKVLDGQKVYIPKVGESKTSSTSSTSGAQVGGLVNINSATFKDLDSLPGIGETRAQSIISGRPYASPEELVTRKILPKSVYEKIKEKITAY